MALDALLFVPLPLPLPSASRGPDPRGQRGKGLVRGGDGLVQWRLLRVDVRETKMELGHYSVELSGSMCMKQGSKMKDFIRTRKRDLLRRTEQ